MEAAYPGNHSRTREELMYNIYNWYAALALWCSLGFIIAVWWLWELGIQRGFDIVMDYDPGLIRVLWYVLVITIMGPASLLILIRKDQ
jgi:hypothetical protein